MDLAPEPLLDSIRQIRRAQGCVFGPLLRDNAITSASSLCDRRGPGFCGTSAAIPPPSSKTCA
jgi:hypothetical protein